MSEFGDVLATAINKKDTDINYFAWKYQNGKEKRFMDMEQDELQKCYKHAHDMLWNTHPYRPGKYVIKDNIQKAYKNCNAELFMRYLLHELNIDNLKTNKDLAEFLVSKGLSTSSYITEIFSNVPAVFEKVTIDMLLNACFDKLDVLNTKIVSPSFIISQGIWLTKDEKKELTEYDENGNMRKWLDVMKERLILNNVRLRIDQKGLSYDEFRRLVQLGDSPKYSQLPTNTLKLLRDKIFLLLDNDLNYHINKWTNICNQIKAVADYKQIVLKCEK